MKVIVTGVSKQQMETAMQKVLAHKFTVNLNQIAVTATESRRLEEAARRLKSGNWDIDFTISQLTSVAKFNAVQNTAVSISNNRDSMKPTMVKELKAAGATSVTESSLTVQTFISTTPSVGGHTSFTGSIQISVGMTVTELQIETAITYALAGKLGCAYTDIGVAATKTSRRRLSDYFRRLSGTWDVFFAVNVPAYSDLSVWKELDKLQTTGNADRVVLGNRVAAQLRSRYSSSLANLKDSQVTVNSFSAKKWVESTSFATRMTTPLSIVLALLATAFLKPETLNIFSPLVATHRA